jgi:pyruvate,water dikinase
MFRNAYDDFQQRDLNGLDAHDLLDLHDVIARKIRGPYGIYAVNDAITQQLHALLGRLIKRFQLGDPVALRNALMCGEKGMESVEPVRSGLQLAKHIRADGALAAVFQSSAESDEIWRIVHNDDRFIDFRRELSRHLFLYGDRTLDELKLETPVAEDNPKFVVGILRNYLRGGQSVDAMENRERQIRDEAELGITKGLRGHPLRRQLVHLVLRRVRLGMKTRENLRLARSRAFGMSKRVYRALGLRFVKTGLIDDVSDVFYLSEEEISGTVRGAALTQDLRQLVALRKREYEGFGKTQVNGRVVTHGIVAATSLGSNDIQISAKSGDVLRGQGCSPGKITAKARVIHDPNSDLDVSGEILIAPMTDPGWVFLMVASKGLVSEKGSLLSHTAIIGRELGIPTIVGVKDATRLIQNGQTIELDGDAGTVRI